MKKLWLIIIGIVIVLVLTFVITSVTPYFERQELCESSGGTLSYKWSSGGLLYECLCPSGKYEYNYRDDMHECFDITDVEISKCLEMSNEYADCNFTGEFNELFREQVCECSYKERDSQFSIPISNLVNCDNCRCTYEYGCGCGLCSLRKLENDK